MDAPVGVAVGVARFVGVAVVVPVNAGPLNCTNALEHGPATRSGGNSGKLPDEHPSTGTVFSSDTLAKANVKAGGVNTSSAD
jgi:hypothetical protein